MKCDKCSAPASVYQKYSGMHLCTAHFQEDVHRKIRGTLRESGVFAHGAKLAVAVNGSADSAVLIYVLKSLFENRRDIDLIAVMIDEGIAGYSPLALDSAIKLANELHVPFEVLRSKDAFAVAIDELHDTEVLCSICKSMKRELLEKTAFKAGAEALAIGSNLDAEAAEIMTGYLSGAIDGISEVSTRDKREEIQVIKPLRRIPAEEVRLYAEIHEIGSAASPCPYARGLLTDVEKELKDFEARHPGTNYSLLRMKERMEELCTSRDEEGQSL